MPILVPRVLAGRGQRPSHLSLFRRRHVWVPTWRAWLLLLLVIWFAAVPMLRGVHDFLALQDPVSAPEVLVLEGWAADYAFVEAIREFHSHPYRELIVTGGPIEVGAPLSEYKTYAELGAANLVAMGFDPKCVHAVPAPAVMQDRTYASAVALHRWLSERGQTVAQLNLISVGVHSRRSRLVFQKAFGSEAKTGIIRVRDPSFDSQRWWRFSQGFRVVVDEAIAYIYTKLLFRA